MTPFDELHQGLVNSFKFRRTTNREMPPALYHYTGAAAFESILRSGQLRFTNAAYFADANELDYPSQLAADALSDRIKTGSFRNEGLVSTLLGLFSQKTDDLNWYVTCLSAEPCLLSQWRAYTPHGGYAIGFEPSELEEQFARLGARFGPIEYDQDKQVSRLFAVLDVVLERWGEWLARQTLSPLERERCTLRYAGIAYAQVFVNEFIFWKASDFEEENEWRAILSIQPHATGLEFTSRNGLLVPYKHFRITKPGQKLPKLYAIQVSPIGDAKLAGHAAETLLHQLGVVNPARFIKLPRIVLR